MADKTKIEWTATVNPDGSVTPGASWNPIRARRRDILDEKTLMQPLHWKRPRRIFVCSMTDWCAEFVTYEMRDRIMAVAALCPQHSFLFLTKRAAEQYRYMMRLSKSIAPLEKVARSIGRTFEFDGLDGGRFSLLPWPIRNCWLGISAEDQLRADERIPLLFQTPAAVRFVSLEPLLGPINLDSDERDGLHALGCGNEPDCGCGTTRLDWVIVGGESGRNARPMNPAWARSIRDQCTAAGVRFFFKQWGEYGWEQQYLDGTPGPGCVMAPNRLGKHAAGRLLDGREWSEYPA